ncbi:hypothetical protein [Sorangium sp. So ce406]|uniref:hypothetical protein n=1 Tax=Sorangium sp. So ce406 TaxID=3133311 RepID=UPI003F5BDC8A
MSLIRSSIRLAGFAALCTSLLGTTSCLRVSDDGGGLGGGGAGSSSSNSSSNSGSSGSGTGGAGGGDTGSGTGGAGGVDTGSGTGGAGGGSGDTGSGTGGAGGGSGGASNCEDDVYEWNDVPTSAAPLAYTAGGSGSLDAWFSRMDFMLCQGDEDWYLLDTSLGYEEFYWRLRVLAAGAELCGASCEQYTPPSRPDNTVIVEVYSAATMDLIGAGQSDHGRVWLDGGGLDSANDLLLRIYGPPEATYPYDITFIAKSYDGEDECEC